ncbi:putative RNA-binding protein EIF1AD [Gracilariopsis chorda]|uniref:Putative RNA-binding protein EIF1AD n=1 Tax=Gracilariopsis chorda TaxID=448386 RepID=A0A2V3IV77_9FLOR|nr:putative RNA-binding protein EIF1AD [Gracilariopsis chorda]|eukprot:PXF45993.1 putative RNA-binding protein EIF1AD [Gracilariopsis chorda]
MTTPGNRRRRTQLLSELPALKPGQQVAQITRALGENTYEVRLEGGHLQLVRLPKRLRDVAYIRRDSFVFVREHAEARGRVVGDIELVVLPAFLPALRKEHFWPAAFHPHRLKRDEHDVPVHDSSDSAEEDDWQLGQGNPNRRMLSHMASSDEELSSDEEHSEDDDDRQPTAHSH